MLEIFKEIDLNGDKGHKLISLDGLNADNDGEPMSFGGSAKRIESWQDDRVLAPHFSSW